MRRLLPILLALLIANIATAQQKYNYAAQQKYLPVEVIQNFYLGMTYTEFLKNIKPDNFETDHSLNDSFVVMKKYYPANETADELTEINFCFTKTPGRYNSDSIAGNSKLFRISVGFLGVEGADGYCKVFNDNKTAKRSSYEEYKPVWEFETTDGMKWRVIEDGFYVNMTGKIAGTPWFTVW